MNPNSLSERSVQRKWVSVVALSIIVLLLAAVFLWPLTSERTMPYRQVMQAHQRPMPWQGHPIVAMITFFPTGSPSYAEATQVYAAVAPTSAPPNKANNGLSDAWIIEQRYIIDAVQGGGSNTDLATLKKVQSLPPLPPSTVSVSPLWVRNLVVASKLENGVWRTRYYDRRHMPDVVRNLGILCNASYNDGKGHQVSLIDGHVIRTYY